MGFIPFKKMKPINTISRASQLVGVSRSVLRIWELRYHWPIPLRDSSSGYRVYTADQIRCLIAIKVMLEKGYKIGELIVEEQPNRALLFPYHVKKPRVIYDFSSIPLPLTRDGRYVRTMLETAYHAGDFSKINLCLHLKDRLPPADRPTAVDQLVELAKKLESTPSLT